MKRVWIPAVVFVIAASLVTALYFKYRTLPLPRQYNRTGLHGGFIQPDRFIVGANYPWIEYAGDFGGNAWGHRGISEPSKQAQIDQDFAWFQQHNIRVVRWFMFCDARAGIVFSQDGTVQGLDPYVFKDMDVAVDEARKHNLMLIMVLFDYNLAQKPEHLAGVQTSGRSNLISDTKARESLMNNALKPLFARYGHDGAVVAWEIINEPEWCTRVPGGGFDQYAVSKGAMQQFVAEAAALIHSDTEQAATVGSARRNFLYLWKQSGLDFYQYHFYPWMEHGLGRTPYNYAAARLKLDKPCLVGEMPTNVATDYVRYLDQGLANQYAGTLGWSLRATDKYSQLKQRGNDIDLWRVTHSYAVRP
jgi:hypothetical protein